FQPGERVQLHGGSFRELEAIFVSADGEERSVILLNLLQREQKVRVPTQFLRLCAHPELVVGCRIEWGSTKKVQRLVSRNMPQVGGGAEIVVRQLAEGLQDRGCDVTVLVTGPETGLHEEVHNGVRIYRAGLYNFYWHYTQARANPLLRLGWHYRDRYNRRM